MVHSKRSPTVHMIHSVVACVCPVACPSAPSVHPVFSTNNGVLTQDRGPAYAKYPDFAGFFDVIRSAPNGGGGDNDRWPKDMTVHGDKTFRAGNLLVPKDMSDHLVSQWHKTCTLHAAGKKLPQSIQAPFEVSQLKDICKNVSAHCTVCQAQIPANYKAPSNS